MYGFFTSLIFSWESDAPIAHALEI